MRLRDILFAVLLASALAGCGPAYRLTFAERAYIHCRETGRDDACVGGVSTAWSELARACGIRSNVLRVCDAEFERRYFCNVSTREEKTTDEKGNVTTKTVEIRSGPGCGMDSSRRYELGRAYIAECERRSFVPDTSSMEGAACYCGSTSCTFDYPNVSDETAVFYFPHTADK
jgi:hypothetical protein